ncbi:2-hydroxyacyl-CoA dehydratase [candidate division KSB1 bacterium]|nr:2-hydroxyacyl-CoA dehydratase [candidate division KSB1 bacterium]
MANTGLARAKEILRSRQEYARALQRDGKKVVGYLSIHVPLEIVEAFDVVPFRILGDIREPVTEADRGLPAAFCPYMRSVLDLSLKGNLSFLDGFAMAHPCDAQEKTARVLLSFVNFPFTHFIDIPATTHGYAVEYFRNQIDNFCTQMSRFVGRPLSQEKLRETTRAYNEQRALVRALYDLNRADPPALSGRETLEVILAVQSLPVGPSLSLLREVIAEAGSRGHGGPPKRRRVMVWGSVVDDAAYLDVIEAGGANVVTDDLDEGTRPFQSDVDTSGDLMSALAKRYLVDVRTARTFIDKGQGAMKKDHVTDLEARYSHLRRFIEGWDVDGVILLTVRYCDPHGFEMVDLMDYLRYLKVPFTSVEHNYSEGALAPMRTRIEAFIETLDE